MKIIFDIILVLFMLAVMVMLLRGVNQLAHPLEENKEPEVEPVNEEFKDENEKLARKGFNVSLLLKRVSVNDRDCQK